MSDVVEKMNALVTAWGDSDRRCLFAHAYRTMTSSMLRAIEAGEFDDDEWVGRLLDRFADYYFDAVVLYDSDPPRCPQVWTMAFDAGVDEELHSLRVLLLGINAHINYDLAFSVADVLDDWADLDESRRASRRSDYERVDAVIRRTVDLVQSEVVEPVAPEMGVVDRLLGPIDEWLFSALITDWRNDTWEDAIRILESGTGRLDETRSQIEERALATADRIIHVGPG